MSILRYFEACDIVSKYFLFSHLVRQNTTILAIFGKGLVRNISVKLF